jgi:hypothetical protein
MSATLEHQNDNLYLLRVGGMLKKADLDAVQTEYVQKFSGAGTVKVLIRLENFTGWEGAAWDDTGFFFRHLDDFEKIAIVGEPRWEEETLAFTGAGIRKGPVKFFPETDEHEARAWLAE